MLQKEQMEQQMEQQMEEKEATSTRTVSVDSEIIRPVGAGDESTPEQVAARIANVLIEDHDGAQLGALHLEFTYNA